MAAAVLACLAGACAGLPSASPAARTDQMPPALRGTSAIFEIGRPPDENIAAQSPGVNFNATDNCLEYAAQDGMPGWVLYSWTDINEDFYPSSVWFENNGKDYWIALPNYHEQRWEFFDGRNISIAPDGSVTGTKTLVHTPWNHYVNAAGEFQVALIAADDRLTTGLAGADMTYDTIKTPKGLKLGTILGGIMNVSWSAYSDPRDLQIEVLYTGPGVDQVRVKKFAENATSGALPNFTGSQYCIRAAWPLHDVRSAESDWLGP